ncbi:MAG: helix-turn-helix domain-containing protein [Gammaproteobacteria bacterium]|nr:helix-turn-helix domain-containing protein [Gammaproteobacteria bacterium]
MKANHWQHSDEKLKKPLHYPECGLDDVYLVSGYDAVKTPYGKGIVVKNVDALLRAIGCSLATEKKALTGKELRFLRKQMSLTQSELGQIVGLSSQQVARWEKGEYEIPGPAERLVRLLFIQHDGGNVDLRQLLRKLEERDAPAKETLIFEKTAKGWHTTKAA